MTMSTTADERLLQQPRDLGACTEIILALQPKRVFNVRTGREGIALLAQDAQAAVPELVSSGADGFLRLDYELLSVYLIGAIKELDARLKKLEPVAPV